MSLTPSPGTLGGLGLNQNKQAAPAAANTGSNRTEITPPKCFGTDYFGKWNQTGMTYESMKIDRPDYQIKCANCEFFEKCYFLNHLKLIKMKR